MHRIYDTISESIDFIVGQDQTCPPLPYLAQRAGYSESHFQKLFLSYVGLSPSQLWRYMRYQKARDLLFAHTSSTLNSALESGFSGQGRLHDAFVKFEAATPGEVRSKGEGMRIRYGIGASVLGSVLAARTDKGMCWLGFEGGAQEVTRKGTSFHRMQQKWPKAEFVRDDKAIIDVVEKINAIWSKDKRLTVNQKLALHIFGTNFQIQVWQALMQIPLGMLSSYKDVAETIQCPKAYRAVGSAVGDNPVSLLIPCHRVIQSSGIVKNYGWGDARKKCILLMEQKQIAE